MAVAGSGAADRQAGDGADELVIAPEASGSRGNDLWVMKIGQSPVRLTDDTDRDGLPNVLMEAASQKLPILATAAA